MTHRPVVRALKRRVLDSGAIGCAAALSLLLLLFVAYSDAKRTSERFAVDKLSAQGQILQGAIEAFVRPGLPLRQFVGFGTLAEAAVQADPLIASVSALDMHGERVFGVGSITSHPVPPAARAASGALEVTMSPEAMQVALPIRNRFEQVGLIVLGAPRDRITAQMQQIFAPLAGLAILVCVVLALVIFCLPQRLGEEARFRWAGFGFVTAFVAIAAVTVAVLVGIYSDGAQSRARSLASSLAQRLDDIGAYGLSFEDITGIDSLLGEYKSANPDIRDAALMAGSRVLAQPGRDATAGEGDRRDSDYEFSVSLAARDEARAAQVRVALPRDVVVRQVIRSIKNFAALLVASGLFAALWIGMVRAQQRRHAVTADTDPEEVKAVAIALVKPVFFLAVFSEHLCYAFLPQLTQALVAQQGLPSGYASAPFTAYYFVFAAALMAAGRLERVASARSLLMIGLALCICGMGLMASSAGLLSMTAARCLAGAGQGTVLIGTQAYLLANAPRAGRTRAGSIIVFGFQAGMVAGMAIGSLLVASIDAQGIFILAGIVAAATLLYVRFALPAARAPEHAVATGTRSLWRDVVALMRDGVFSRTVLFIGVPAKALLTGVILFGMPLLLSHQGYAKEDIGQITMLYAGAVMMASVVASARADKTADTQSLLFQGSCLTACGLGLVALPGLFAPFGWAPNGALVTLAVVAGVIVIGLAHGLINAPIVTHVVDARVARRVGGTSTAATYRLLERAGHVGGPVLMAQVFVLFGPSWGAFAAMGLVVLILGLLFQVLGRGTPHRDVHQMKTV